jgi:methylated-DNA-[protein]-cysteine S-methyltransferase
MTHTPTTTAQADLRRRTMTTPIGALELIAGPAGLRAVLWPGEDGSRVTRAIGAPAHPMRTGADGSPGVASGPETATRNGIAAGDRSGVGAVAADHPDTSRAEGHLDRAQAQLGEYFAGTRRDFDLDLDPAGTDFQLRAWEALRTIPYGRTISYGEQAMQIGETGAARAVGAADGRNPLSIVVPCHRVVAASGALTGFAGGLDIKAWLLHHERTVLARG